MRPRVLYFCISAQMGGAEQSLLSLVKKNRGQQDVKFLFPVKNGPLIDRLKKEGFLVDTLEMPQALLQSSRKKFVLSAGHFFLTWPMAIRYFYTLKKYLLRTRFDIVHCTGLKCHLLAALACFNSPTQVLLHVRDVFRSPAVIEAMKLFLKLPNVHAIYNSQASATPIEPRGSVIYNGFELEETSTLEEIPGEMELDIRKELCLAKETKLIAHVGVFADWKGQDVFLEIAKKLLSKNQNLHFLLIGDEIYDTQGEKGIRSQLREIVNKYKIEESVSFLGFRSDVIKILKSCNVFCHTSKKPEPFGRVLIEAMIAEVPVVASRDGGVLEIIEHEKNGLLCEPLNIQQYSSAIEHLLENHELRKELTKSASETVRKRFSIESHSQKINELYFSLIAHRQLQSQLQNHKTSS